MRCQFSEISWRINDDGKQYRYACISCGIKTGWTRVSDPAKVLCQCSKSPTGIECVYRGAVIGQHDCEVCGMRGRTADVYQCALLDAPCVIRPWTNLRRKMEGETACITCRERMLADGTKPWASLSSVD